MKKKMLAHVVLALGMVAGTAGRGSAQGGKPAEDVLRRMMPGLAPQIHLELRAAKDGHDSFRVSGTKGNIHVQAATVPTLLFGVNWYLRYVAHMDVTTNGVQLGRTG